MVGLLFTHASFLLPFRSSVRKPRVDSLVGKSEDPERCFTIQHRLLCVNKVIQLISMEIMSNTCRYKRILYHNMELLQ